jgi:putative heme-binding domain-containing protein
LPALRRALNAATAAAVLDYLADSLRHSWRPASDELNPLLDALPAAAKFQGMKVRKLWRQGAEGQAARLTAFAPLLQGGDPGRGRPIFFGKKVACATCHRIGAEGGRIGPDLTKVGAIRAGRDILESVLFPSSTIAQGYESYYVSTSKGRVATGVLARQTPDVIVLRNSSGAEEQFHRGEIEEMRRLGKSLMPEGLERAMTRQEFRDLLAFLQSLK